MSRTQEPWVGHALSRVYIPSPSKLHCWMSYLRSRTEIFFRCLLQMSMLCHLYGGMKGKLRTHFFFFLLFSSLNPLLSILIPSPTYTSGSRKLPSFGLLQQWENFQVCTELPDPKPVLLFHETNAAKGVSPALDSCLCHYNRESRLISLIYGFLLVYSNTWQLYSFSTRSGELLTTFLDMTAKAETTKIKIGK